ncbi:hypothetical protein CVT26_009182 [Gymnopilus dilepis]|uniref:Uncharacterized protein n=1 Tax=Gymnopilus dilepis TaxID=231916 RepID=A0A409Y939_9AGAR|nr:hypothetical protein CVT26_009182 [Gymnopilus dilepis]
MCLHQPIPRAAQSAQHNPVLDLDRPLTPSSYTLPEFIKLGVERAHLDRPYRPLTPGNDNPNLSSTKRLTADDFRADYYRFYKGPLWVVGHGVPIGFHNNWNNAQAASHGFKGSPGYTRRDDFDAALVFFLELIHADNVVLRRRTEQRDYSTPTPKKSGTNSRAGTSTPSSQTWTHASSRSSTHEPSTPRASSAPTPRPAQAIEPLTPRPAQSPGHSFDNPIILYTPTPPKVNLATKPKPSQHALTSAAPAGAGIPASPTPAGIHVPSSPSPAQGSSKGLKVRVVDNSDEAYRRLPRYPSALGAAISSLTGYEIGNHSTPRAKAVVDKPSPSVSDKFNYDDNFFATIDAIEAKAYSTGTSSDPSSSKGKGVDRD